MAVISGCRLGPEDNKLVRASSRCHAEEVDRLLSAGWDPNEPDETGVSAMQAAAAGGFDATPDGACVETLEVLLAAGGDPSRVSDGRTLVVDAVFASDPSVISWIVDQGANPCLPLPELVAERYVVDTLVELAEAEGAPGAAAAIAEAMAAHC
ncbi:MAG: ankyrin repeat domain-containing protein [Acidimicrobiales bacterium]